MPPIPRNIAVPVRFEGGVEATVPANTADDIRTNLAILAGYRPGDRVERPDFGIPGQALRKGGADTRQILAAVDEFEPRARAEIDPGEIVDRVQHVAVSANPEDAT